MDGIDGITSTQTIAICVGFILIGFVQIPLIIIFALLGFLIHNWHPAKIFMGDVGSVPLGYIIGVMLIILAKSGFLISAIILPLYYLADSTITITKRLLARKKIWEAHSEHYYQQAVRAGKSHSSVVKMISFANILLIICAVIAAHSEYQIYALIGAILIVAVLLCWLKPKKVNSS